MPFDLQHWKKPRATIANEFQNNDFGYLNHAFSVAAEVIRNLDFKPSQLRQLRALDYGCGTGRMSIALSHIFKAVDGYDPVSECIEQANLDRDKSAGKTCSMRNLTFSDSFNEFSHSTYDVVYAVSVLEHLTLPDQIIALENINRCLAPSSGKAILWIHTVKNRALFDCLHLRSPGMVIVATLDRHILAEAIDAMRKM